MVWMHQTAGYSRRSIEIKLGEMLDDGVKAKCVSQLFLVSSTAIILLAVNSDRISYYCDLQIKVIMTMMW